MRTTSVHRQRGSSINAKLNVQFSYELAYGGNLSVNQNRGPLAGAVAGQFPGTYMNFFQVSFIWGGGGTTAASGMN
ncbi:MAG: hypothetical protein AB7G48_10435 [Nitrospiraceae bacterium]